jgi:CRISPR-associated protein Csm2
MGYYNEAGVIREELVDKKAFDIANSFVTKDRRKPQLSSAQMRRFFSEFRQLEKKVKIQGFEKVKPLIKMVKSKASYAANRPKPIPETFKCFLIDNVDQINTEKDFETFMIHFEAVVGFFYGIPEVRNN